VELLNVAGYIFTIRDLFYFLLGAIPLLIGIKLIGRRALLLSQNLSRPIYVIASTSKSMVHEVNLIKQSGVFSRVILFPSHKGLDLISENGIIVYGYTPPTNENGLGGMIRNQDNLSFVFWECLSVLRAWEGGASKTIKRFPFPLRALRVPRSGTRILHLRKANPAVCGGVSAKVGCGNSFFPFTPFFLPQHFHFYVFFWKKVRTWFKMCT